MDDHFFTAYFPGEATVCGRKLTTFSAYHYLLLKSLGSPFLSPDGIIGTADLLIAVQACRHRFGQPVIIRPRLRDIIWKIRMMHNPRLFRRECRIFAAWIKSHSSGPRFWTVISGGQKTRDLTGPDILTLIAPLMMKTSITESDAWNMSLGRAQWLNAEIQEIEGSERRFLFDGDLTDPEEEEVANA